MKSAGRRRHESSVELQLQLYDPFVQRTVHQRADGHGLELLSRGVSLSRIACETQTSRELDRVARVTHSGAEMEKHPIGTAFQRGAREERMPDLAQEVVDAV